MASLRESAPAKINLYLHVTGKRADGYHLLESLVAFADIGDHLAAELADDVTVKVTGPFAAAVPADNSVMRAARALRAVGHVSKGAAITLHKDLPVAAGIGGGSADAAATLRLLLRLWNLELAPGALAAIALSLGADVPACLRSNALYMLGIGDEIENGPILSDLYAVLVNPGAQLLTHDVFARASNEFTAPHARPAVFTTPHDTVDYLLLNRNDLQSPAQALCPQIAEVLAALSQSKDCMLARMSGSGATCFGLFYSLDAAELHAQAIRAQHPGWWAAAATIG